MEEMDKIDRSIIFSEINPKPISTHNCIHSVTKMESLETVQDEKWSNKPLPPLYTFLCHLMLPKEWWLQCSHNAPTEASYDKLTLIKCMAREEWKALQRKVVPFHEFRDIKPEAANTNPCELLSDDWKPRQALGPWFTTCSQGHWATSQRCTSSFKSLPRTFLQTCISKKT